MFPLSNVNLETQLCTNLQQLRDPIQSVSIHLNVTNKIQKKKLKDETHFSRP